MDLRSLVYRLSPIADAAARDHANAAREAERLSVDLAAEGVDENEIGRAYNAAHHRAGLLEDRARLIREAMAALEEAIELGEKVGA